MHIVCINLRIFLLFSFYLCKFFCVMPIKFVKFLDNSFRISLMGACISVTVLAIDFIYIYDRFCRLRSCKLNSECPESYIGLIDACYCFSLIFSIVFFKAHQVSCMMNELFISVTTENIKQTLIYSQAFVLYIFIVIEFLRIMFLEPPDASFIDILFWVLTIFVKNVAYSLDGLIVLTFFIAKTKVYNINCQLLNVYHSEDVKTQLHNLLIIYWQWFNLLKTISRCFGSLFVIISLYKLLQILGIVYFTILANNIFDMNQALDIIFPTLCIIFICSTATSLYNEVHYSKFILGSLLSKKDEFDVNPEIEMLSYLMRFRSHTLNAGNFFVIHLTVFIKICSLTLIYVLTLLQILQMNDP